MSSEIIITGLTAQHVMSKAGLIYATGVSSLTITDVSYTDSVGRLLVADSTEVTFGGYF